MKGLIMFKLVLFLLILSSTSFAQDLFPGKHKVVTTENGIAVSKVIVVPEKINQFGVQGIEANSIVQTDMPLSSSVRWSYFEPAAVGEKCVISGNGKYSVVGWMLNNHRISLHDNSSSVPLWEYVTGQGSYINFVSISDTGGVIALGSNLNILMFTNASNTPFFNFDLTQLGDTGIATNLDLSRNGQFLVASVSRNDSSTIFGFNSTSTTPVWKKRLQPTITTGGGSVQGVRMSGNDSLVIVNTYAEFYVMNSYTGQIIYSGLINPSSPSSGTQSPQAISGDGSVIATINYSGILRVYQRSGSTYNFLWQNQEPPGQFFNWYTSVDINYNGEYIAAGTLNFVTSSSYDGKVKVFKRSGSGTPQWTFAGCGDEVNALSFSQSGSILAAASWGDFNGASPDLFIFKTFFGNIPLFRVETPGSFFACGTSTDGRTVVASGKAVHARQFGSGGIMFNVEIDTSEIPTSIATSGSELVDNFELQQNYPNPFNPETTIEFELPEKNFTSLIIYNVRGQIVETLSSTVLNKGIYSVSWNAADFPSGVYFYTLSSGNLTQTKKLSLIK
ncbi:MAG: T9SS type A sorting domain-containing protein [Ignavibacteria bacterium]|nr:T9SS type A sorting domain-containing protein [Ignavibacteria bacterium]